MPKKLNSHIVKFLAIASVLMTVACSDTQQVDEGTESDESLIFDGALNGMTGTRPNAVNNAWRNRLNDFWISEGNEPLKSFQYAAESYDSVVLSALAAEIAGTDGSALADEIVGLTRNGTKCVTFAECKKLIADGVNIDYDGNSGRLTMNGLGEVVETNYSVVTFGTDNRVDNSKTQYEEILGTWAYVPIERPTRNRPGNGVLKIGSILPLTGQLATFGPPQFAGLEFAIFEINAAGGVLGEPVEYVEGDSGDTSSSKAEETAARLIAEDVDVVIGPSSTTVTINVIEQFLDAEIVQISPANTNMQLVGYQDRGLYFRTAPADDQQSFLLARVMQDLGSKTVYVAAVDDLYGNSIADQLKRQLERRGITVVPVNLYSPVTADFQPMVLEMLASKADSIVLIGFEETSRILRIMVREGVGPASRKVFGVDANMGDATGENFDVSGD